MQLLPFLGGATSLARELAGSVATLAVCVVSDVLPPLLHRVFPAPVAIVGDSAMHGVIAGVVWAAAVWANSVAVEPWLTSELLRGKQRDACSRVAARLHALLSPHAGLVLTSVACAALSCALDFDHFIAAGSLHLGAATSLPSRPFGHSVTFVVVVVAVAVAVAASAAEGSGGNSSGGGGGGILALLPPLIAVAWLTHQLRDSIRRGLWFWPGPSTPPLPYAVYLLLLAASVPLTGMWLRHVAGVSAAAAAVAGSGGGGSSYGARASGADDDGVGRATWTGTLSSVDAAVAESESEV